MIKKDFFKKIIITSFALSLLVNTNLVIAEGESPEIPPVETPVVLKENIVIRNGGSVIYDSSIDLPSAGEIDVLDKSGVSHKISSRSVLGLLYSIDLVDNNFSLSNLNYDSSYGSLYLKCLTPKDGGELCDNWQYTVNNSYPYVGMDKNELSGNERVYIYFGPQNRVLLNKNSITTTEELTVSAEKYNYEDNTWLPRSGVTVGVTKPIPNSWNPDDSIKNLVDDTGVVKFSNIPEGSYGVGVKEDYYWPTEALTVTKAVETGSSGGGSSTTPQVEDKTFSISKAFDFLIKNQQSDGSYGSSMYTDWVAISVKAGNNSSLKSSVSNYIKSSSLDDTNLTDYERRAMALMSLGINPYNGTSTNYIENIIDSFDGSQFGDSSLINDDIFALIVLKNAGYKISDDIISKDINYIISKQDPNGSWGSVDMTGASIQALKGFESFSNVSDSITKATSFILSNQGSDGSYGNVSSASWAIQSILNEDISKTEKYLASKQGTDGGILENDSDDTNTRIWKTAYVIPAILHKTWNEIMSTFSKQISGSSTSSFSTKVEKKEEVVAPVLLPLEKKEEVIPIVKKEEIKKPVYSNKKPKEILSQKKVTTQTKKETPKFQEQNNKIEAKNDLQNKSKVLSGISSFWKVIKSPFSWFWDKLGF